MPDHSTVKGAIENAFHDSVKDHFKNLITNGIDTDIAPERRRESLKVRFVHGLKDRLLAYELAIDAVHEVLGHDDHVLRDSLPERRT